MRRTVLVAAAVAIVLALAAGVALAQSFGDVGRGVTKTCKTRCVGTQYPDTLIGTNNRNVIKGLGTHESASFGDKIEGHGGNDTLDGDQGGDLIEGGSGDDAVNGDSGNDQVIGGTGNDHISTGPGHDLVRAVDHQRDHIDCGESASDRVYYDRNLDILSDCERRTAR